MKVIFEVESVRQKQEGGLSPNEIDYYESWVKVPSNFQLTYKSKYTVYGIRYRTDQSVRFMIVDDSGVIYPKIYPAEFFSIEDSRLSQLWDTSDRYYPIKLPRYPSWVTFKQFLEDDSYYEDLINGNQQAISDFLVVKRRMDLEFPDSSIPYAEVIQGNWIKCAHCGEVWENFSTEGIVVCPKNMELSNNPLWTDHKVKR